MQSRSPLWLIQRCHAVRFTIASPRLRTFASTASRRATSAPELYDVVCVGGGPAGLSLLAGLSTVRIDTALTITNAIRPRSFPSNLWPQGCSYRGTGSREEPNPDIFTDGLLQPMQLSYSGFCPIFAGYDVMTSCLSQ
jgi:hypothetical protein